MLTTFLILSFIAWSLPPQSLVLAHESDLSPAQLRGEPAASVPKDCGPNAHWNAATGRCRRDALPPGTPDEKAAPNLLPPPAGVIVLRPGGVREQASVCPEDFREEAGEHGWRFCVYPNYREPLPPLWEPPVAGIPYVEALEILKRHQQKLIQLPGVTGIGVGETGIIVETDNPALLPPEIEGLPIEAAPPQIRKFMNHTSLSRVRPLHGAALIGSADFFSNGTLTGVVLSEGRPWLIFPTHVGVRDCDESPPDCPIGSPAVLNQCMPYAGDRTILQSPFLQALEQVGHIQRWDPLPKNNLLLTSTDVAAAFLDNDLVNDNASVHADRMIEEFGSFSGQEGTPTRRRNVTIISSLSTTDGHKMFATISDINRLIAVAGPTDCNEGGDVVLTNQMILTMKPDSDCPILGDSGSPIIDDGNGRILGMLNWSGGCVAGGTQAPTIRTKLGFEHWYGTGTSGFKLKCH